MIQGLSQGVVDKAELRNWLYPSETMEQSEDKVKEIEEKTPTTEDLLGKGDEE